MHTALVATRAAGLRATRSARHIAPRARSYATPAVVNEDADPQLADYPSLPWVSRQRLPALAPYDDFQMRRNFGEPLHEKEEILSMWGPDAAPMPPSTALRHFTLAVLGFVTFGTIVRFGLVPSRPAVPREYPYSGLVTELGGLEDNQARPESEDDAE